MAEYVFAVEASGHEQITCRAENEHAALRKALELWGAAGDSNGIDGLCVRQASAAETVTYCRDMGLQMEFCIRHPKHGELAMLAGSKLEALMRASQEWKAAFSFGWMDECKVMVSRRIFENEHRHDSGAGSADDFLNRTSRSG